MLEKRDRTRKDIESMRVRYRIYNPSMEKIGILLGFSKDDVIERQRARIEELENIVTDPYVKVNLPMHIDW